MSVRQRHLSIALVSSAQPQKPAGDFEAIRPKGCLVRPRLSCNSEVDQASDVRTVRTRRRSLDPKVASRMSDSASSQPTDSQLTTVKAVAAEVPCIYCRTPISAQLFEFLSPGRRLVMVACPTCDRTVRMRAAAWRREAARTLHLQG